MAVFVLRGVPAEMACSGGNKAMQAIVVSGLRRTCRWDMEVGCKAGEGLLLSRA